MRKLKMTRKRLLILESGFIYCKRRNIIYDDNDYVEKWLDFNEEDKLELDNIEEDLRNYRYESDYILQYITEEEYEMCVDEFGEQL